MMTPTRSVIAASSPLPRAATAEAAIHALPTGNERPCHKATDASRTTLERFVTLSADREEISEVGRQRPADGGILLEAVIIAGGRSGADQFPHFVPASIERDAAGSGGEDVRQPSISGESRSWVRIIGCDQH